MDLDDHVIHLLFSANRWEDSGAIVAALNAGCHVILDRYAFSGVAFSAAKGMDVEWCRSPDRGLPSPDVVFLLRAPLSDLTGRTAFGAERYETIEFLQKVDHMFLALQDSTFRIIDATRPIDDIHDEVLQCFVHTHSSQNPSGKPISGLWQ